MIDHLLLGDALPVVLDNRSAEIGGCFWQMPLQTYGPMALKWAYEQLQQQTNPVMLDIGASSGCFTLLAKFIPGMFTYAFEPVPESWAILERNIAYNGLRDRAFPFKMALSNFNGYSDEFRVVFPIGGSGVSMLGGMPQIGKMYHNILVKVHTIDEICINALIAPTLIKIDVEGQELMVLQGGQKTIEKYHPVIIAECEPANTAQYDYEPDLIYRWLAERGYEIENPHGEDFLCIWKG